MICDDVVVLRQSENLTGNSSEIVKDKLRLLAVHELAQAEAHCRGGDERRDVCQKVSVKPITWAGL